MGLAKAAGKIVLDAAVSFFPLDRGCQDLPPGFAAKERLAKRLGLSTPWIGGV
jgi:hypothetical protein